MIAGLSGSKKASIVLSILDAVSETGTYILSLTFDGAQVTWLWQINLQSMFTASKFEELVPAQ